VKLYKCCFCGTTDPSKFEKGYKGKCASCRSKERRRNPEYREKQAAYYRQWYAENGLERSSGYQDAIILWQAAHPKAMKARWKVLNALRKGSLVRPLKCGMCGKTHCRINAHHPDYDFPYDVMWLCSSCHKKIHSHKNYEIKV